MRNIKDIAKKPSEALRAMVGGLLDQSKRSDFEIDMMTWGSSTKNMCYGCAAACTIQKLSGINFKADTDISCPYDRAAILGFDGDDLNEFENCINDARMGELGCLFRYYGLDREIPNDNGWNDEFFLHDCDWKYQLPTVMSVIELMDKAGY